MLHPRLFHKSDDLTVIFDVKFNSVNICWSRKNYDQYLSSKDITDEVCQGVSVTSGSISSRKATLNWKDPCDGLPPGILKKKKEKKETFEPFGQNNRNLSRLDQKDKKI